VTPYVIRIVFWSAWSSLNRLSVAVEPKTKADQEKMGVALEVNWRLKILLSSA
jgi:hypothetical protein